ncbi:MAG: hypothetical protein BV458_03830 [Thermoplasmata archaeon M9B2D]|nr:MAG: hypothetical protein BV458_03830 [Thermoplasmata archaeon M9B2D]
MRIIHLHHEKICYICGKKIDFLSGYYHPTLGKHFIICEDCYNIEQKSVDQWGRFILWNSFNPESPDPTYIDNHPFQKNTVEYPYKKEKHNKQGTNQ